MSSPDIFQLLRELDRGNLGYFDTLPPEEQKKIPMVVLYRWFSGTSDALQIVLGNEMCNKHVFSLSQHPGLLWKLLVASGSHKSKKYKWIAQSKASSYPMTSKLVAEAVGIVQDVPNYIAELIDSEAATALATQHGWEAPDVKKLQQELKRS